MKKYYSVVKCWLLIIILPVILTAVNWTGVPWVTTVYYFLYGFTLAVLSIEESDKRDNSSLRYYIGVAMTTVAWPLICVIALYLYERELLLEEN